jgi:ABC-type multidrug transport system ATPase subunit
MSPELMPSRVSSGAGKTTLMDVLAGRKTTGSITGEILVNGRPKVQQTFSRVTGYVEQVW